VLSPDRFRRRLELEQEQQARKLLYGYFENRKYRATFGENTPFQIKETCPTAEKLI
jgi:hypothetical protein